MKLQFLGAARQVTGSQYYLEADGAHLMVDCGTYQERPYLARNWEKSPLRLRDLHAILLTHAPRRSLRPGAEIGAGGVSRPYSQHLRLGRPGGIGAPRCGRDPGGRCRIQGKTPPQGRPATIEPVKPLYTLKDVDRTLPLLQPVA